MAKYKKKKCKLKLKDISSTWVLKGWHYQSKDSTETTVNGTAVENDLHLRKDNIKNRIKRKKKKGRNKENSKDVNTLFPRQKVG